MRNPAQDLLPVLSRDGRLAGHQLVERHRQRVDVRAVVDVDRPAHGLLGAHVPEGPHQVAGHGQARVVPEPGQAEVGDPERAPLVDQDVGRLDVAVDHPQAVGVLDRLRRLDAQVGHRPEEGAAARRRRGERAG